MERLTQRLRTGEVLMASEYEEKYTVEEWISVLQDRLAAYEDTHMMPPDVMHMRMDMAILTALFNGIDVDRMREIVAAEREGRLLILPCKVGDTVWYEEYGIENGKLVKYGIQPHVVLTHFEYMVAEGKQLNRWLPLGGLGINWFLTREEAEKATGEQWRSSEAWMGEIHCPVGQKGDIGHAGPTEAE